jgi:hypothetical protein
MKEKKIFDDGSTNAAKSIVKSTDSPRYGASVKN